MKLFQVILAISCIIALATATPGHNIIKGNSNKGNVQKNANVHVGISG
ncbi:hypothetical protein FF38_13619 [Lucilia cuprina]|uniref:Uncharacterized protein n=1 Tax=Lucilia cuprina TaxID=7375 RepID=A0A0L0CCG8_LUCCU|nr:hypothetical protein CVS40_12311 [Lucilia cuprina]KNC29154.1 hypothetical protein FF38_13619 [Lucilia cuprina]